MPATTIEEALTAYLLANADLTALVGTRIYPDAVEQGASGDALVYVHQTGDDTPYISGEANDLNRDTFILTAYSDKRKNAAQIRDVLSAMFAGTTPRGFWQPNLFVQGCMPGRKTALTDPPRDASERHDRETTILVTIIWDRR